MTVSLEKNSAQLYPHDLLADSSTQGRWRVAKTKSRREKALAEFLAGYGIGYYLPMLKKRQPGTKRVRYSLVPVFSGYLFFKADDRQRHQAFTSNHIACVIEVADQGQLLKDLGRVQMAISLDAPVYPYDFISIGQEVLIKRGPFKGLHGVVHRKNKNYRLILNVNCLMQSLALNIEAHCIEPLVKSAQVQK